MDLQALRECNTCGALKSESDFGRNRGWPRGFCKSCYNDRHGPRAVERATAWNKANPNKRLATGLRPYGLTVDDYNEMMERQRGCCAICGKSQEEANIGRKANTRFHVDHNHQTGEVRGLLCASCNLGLGMFEADHGSALLEAAAKYIRRTT